MVILIKHNDVSQCAMMGNKVASPATVQRTISINVAILIHVAHTCLKRCIVNFIITNFGEFGVYYESDFLLCFV